MVHKTYRDKKVSVFFVRRFNHSQEEEAAPIEIKEEKEKNQLQKHLPSPSNKEEEPACKLMSVHKTGTPVYSGIKSFQYQQQVSMQLLTKL
jgi:hypothetical protein